MKCAVQIIAQHKSNSTYSAHKKKKKKEKKNIFRLS